MVTICQGPSLLPLERDCAADVLGQINGQIQAGLDRWYPLPGERLELRFRAVLRLRLKRAQRGEMIADLLQQVQLVAVDLRDHLQMAKR